MTEPAQAITDYVSRPFGTFAELFRLQARARLDHTAILCDGHRISYAQLDALQDGLALEAAT